MPCQSVQISGPEPEPEAQPPSQSELFSSFDVEGGVNEARASYTLINPLTQAVSADVVVEVNGRVVDRQTVNLLGRQRVEDTVRATFSLAPGESATQRVCVDLENIQLSG